MGNRGKLRNLNERNNAKVYAETLFAKVNINPVEPVAAAASTGCNADPFQINLLNGGGVERLGPQEVLTGKSRHQQTGNWRARAMRPTITKQDGRSRAQRNRYVASTQSFL